MCFETFSACASSPNSFTPSLTRNGLPPRYTPLKPDSQCSRVEIIDGSDLSKLPGIVWTRELLLERAGFEPVNDLRRALKRTRGALKATDKEGAPDHTIRLRAAEQVYDLAGVSNPKRSESGQDPTRPINVQIILTGPGPDARAALQTHGVRLHLDGHNGHGDGA